MENLINTNNLDELKDNIDDLLSHVPSNYLLCAGAGTWILSAVLKNLGKENAASFVEKWAMPILTVGVYRKLAEASEENENKQNAIPQY